MADKFVNLHVHTEYSLLDGLSNIKRMLGFVKENGMDAIAVTDHGNMYGAIEFYKAAKANEIKPIIGMEGYITNMSLDDRESWSKGKNYHMILLAKNLEGYQNLMELSSIAHVKGYYYRPRVDRPTLAKYAKGLICTSACAQGEVAQAIIDGNMDEAKKIVSWYLEVFGEDYYLEIQRHNMAEAAKNISDPQLKRDVLTMAENETKITNGVVKLSRSLGIPIVATNDSHYIKKEDATAQDALVCIATGKNVTDIKRLRFIDTPTFYLTTPTEMSELFSDIPEAIENTVKVAEKVNLELTLGKWFFPKFSVPGDLPADEYLSKLAHEKIKEKIDKVTPEVKARLEYEIQIINQKGYAPYFLIVMDMVNWANSKGIITNTRGSAAGSLVSFVLGITTVNPLIYYLPFERFLNPYRPSPPDIDFDVSDDRREEIIGYICSKYGQDHVAQICTFGRMLSRAAVRDIARVLGYPYAVGDKISKLIPPPKQGFPVYIKTALEETPELKNLYDNDPDVKKVMDLASQIEGNARHISVHAAGVVVSPSRITDFAPIQKEPSGEKIITQYEMHACEDVGLIKFDILGIRNLSILGAAIQIVKDYRKVNIDIKNVPLDDKKTFEMLGKGETMGTFQMGGAGMTKYLKDLQPTRVEDLMAMVALYRPGPIAVIPEYIKRKKNPKLIKFLDPRMEKFLQASYGLIVYQDDLLFCAIDLAGYSWEEADKFRKAVGKKIPEEMAAQKEKFIAGIIKNGQTQKFAEELWKLFEPFQSYGFNKAHAASYGMVAYQTAYMKANFPVEFMTALLTAESNDKEKVTAAINECRRMGVIVLPPDINESDEGFKIVENKDSLNGLAIRFGFNAIKNVGLAAITAILEARKVGVFTSYGDFLNRIDHRKVNKKVLESLIGVGALSLYGTRPSLLASMEKLRDKTNRNNDDKQPGLFSTDEDEKKEINTQVYNDQPEYGEEELEKLERNLLGFSLSAKSVSELLGDISSSASHKIHELTDEIVTQDIVTIAGIIREVRVITTKKSGAEMAFAKVEDATGELDLVIFPKIYSTTRSLWVENKPLLITGKVDHRDDSTSLLVEKIETDLTKKSEEQFSIKIPVGVKSEQLVKLRELLVANPGNQQVTLIFAQTGEKLDLNQRVWWTSDLSRKVSVILDQPFDS